MHLNALVFSEFSMWNFSGPSVDFSDALPATVPTFRCRTAVGTVGRFMHLGRDPGGLMGLWLSTPFWFKC